MGEQLAHCRSSAVHRKWAISGNPIQKICHAGYLIGNRQFVREVAFTFQGSPDILQHAQQLVAVI